MKVIVVLLVAVAAAAGYGAWHFREQARETDTNLSRALSEEQTRTASLTKTLSEEQTRAASLSKALSEEQARTASLQKETERLQSAVADKESARTSGLAEAGERVAALQGDVEKLRASLADAETSRTDASARADMLAEILGAHHALSSTLVERLRPRYTAVLALQQAFAASPNDARFEAFKGGVAALQESVAQTLKCAETIRQLLAKGSAALDAGKLPRDAMDRVVEKNVSVWKGISAAADATAKSMRRSACAILSNEEWQGAEVDVHAGEIIAVAATGKWRWGVTLGNAVGPEGENGDPDYRVVSAFGNGALIGRIRGSEKVHRAVPLIQPDREGKVEFRINDSYVRDNQGSMDVVAWVFVPFAPAP